MRIVIGLMALGVIFAVLRMALVALIVTLLFFLLLAFMTRPREALSCVLSLGLCGLFTARPVACIVTLGIIALAVVVAGSRPRRSNPLPVIDDKSAAPRIPDA